MPKIIIIEDTHTIREELKTFLTRYGYEVIAPSNFENIIEYTLKEEPDLILLDINLPIFDSYHICSEMRKSSEVPIIIITRRDSEIVKEPEFIEGKLTYDLLKQINKDMHEHVKKYRECIETWIHEIKTT